MNIKKTLATILTTVILLSGTAIGALGATWYVKENASGSGSSWADASGDLENILENSQGGDEIWVAAGTYSPAPGNRFQLLGGSKLYGGFAGTESAIEERNLAQNITVLDGKKQTSIVLYAGGHSTVDDTRIDGFRVTGAHGSGWTAGLYNYVNLTVANCVFADNHSNGYGGGAVTFESSVNFLNCAFVNNSAKFGGGAVLHNAQSSSNTYPIYILMENCTFSNNSSHDGFMRKSDMNRRTQLDIINCTFAGNVSNESYFKFMRIEGKEGITNVVNCVLWDELDYKNEGGLVFKNNLSKNVILNDHASNNNLTGGPGLISLDISGNPAETLNSVYTYKPMEGSLAIGAGLPVGAAAGASTVPTRDQMGSLRPSKGNTTIGAFEAGKASDIGTILTYAILTLGLVALLVLLTFLLRAKKNKQEK